MKISPSGPSQARFSNFGYAHIHVKWLVVKLQSIILSDKNTLQLLPRQEGKPTKNPENNRFSKKNASSRQCECIINKLISLPCRINLIELWFCILSNECNTDVFLNYVRKFQSKSLSDGCYKCSLHKIDQKQFKTVSGLFVNVQVN